QEGSDERVVLPERVDDQRVPTGRQHTRHLPDSRFEPRPVMGAVAGAYQMETGIGEGQRLRISLLCLDLAQALGRGCRRRRAEHAWRGIERDHAADVRCQRKTEVSGATAYIERLRGGWHRLRDQRPCVLQIGPAGMHRTGQVRVGTRVELALDGLLVGAHRLAPWDRWIRSTLDALLSWYKMVSYPITHDTTERPEVACARMIRVSLPPGKGRGLRSVTSCGHDWTGYFPRTSVSRAVADGRQACGARRWLSSAVSVPPGIRGSSRAAPRRSRSRL